MKEKKTVYSKDVLLVMAASFLFMFGTMFITPLINGYAKGLGASASFAGWIVGIMSVAAMLLRPAAGNLTDRFSKFKLSLIGGILILIGILGYVFTPNSQLLLLFRLINGTGYVLCTVCMTTWLAFLVPRSHVGEAMGFYGLMNALAMAMAPAISINLYQKIGYRRAIMIAAVAALLMVIAIQFVGDHALPRPRPAQFKHHFKLIELNALPVALLTALFAIPYFTTQADIVTYARQADRKVTVGAFFLIYAIVLLIIRLGLKRYFDSVRFGIWFWLATISMAICISLLASMENDWEMAGAAVFLALGYGVIYSVLQSTALLLSPIDEQGLASSTFYLGLDIGMALGPILGGMVDALLPIRDFYWVEWLLLPLMILVYLIWRRPLNAAIYRH